LSFGKIKASVIEKKSENRKRKEKRGNGLDATDTGTKTGPRRGWTTSWGTSGRSGKIKGTRLESKTKNISPLPDKSYTVAIACEALKKSPIGTRQAKERRCRNDRRKGKICGAQS